MAVVYYLTPSSFCFGVKRSVEELIKIIDIHKNDPIYCIHALVHNPKITRYFEDRGVHFVEDLAEVKDKNAVVVFSAHGITRSILEQTKSQFAYVYNLECPFVSKIYTEISSYIAQGVTRFVYIGKEGHQEAKNVIDHIINSGGEVYNLLNVDGIASIPFAGPFAILSQTTLNFSLVQGLVAEIQQQFPEALVPRISDICKATYERQGVIKKYQSDFDVLVVIGGKESSNTKELCLIGKELGKKVFFGESLADLLKDQDFIALTEKNIAVTGGASTPIEDILDVLALFEKKGYEKKILDFQESI